MKTEHFDDAFKRKAKGITIQHSEDDIDRVHTYVNNNRKSIAFWPRYGNAVLLSLLGFIATTLVGLNAMQFQNQKLLQKNIDLLEKRISLIDNATSKNKKDTIILIKYLTNTTPVRSRQYNRIDVDYETAYELDHTDLQKYSVIDKTRAHIFNTNVSDHSKKHTYLISNESDFKNQYTHLIAIRQLSDFRLNNPSTNLNIYTGIDSDNDFTLDSGYDAHIYEPSESLKSVETEFDYTSNAIAKLEDSAKFNNVSKEQTDGISTEPIQHDSIQQVREAEETKTKKMISFSKLNYRAGIMIEKGISEAAVGLSGEVLLNRFGLAAGINTLFAADPYKTTNDSYANKKDWLYATHAIYVSDTSNISDIQVKTTVVQIPVAINYYMPLKYNFSLLFSTGTSLDIYARQHIHYDRYTNNSIVEENMNISYPTVVFNNLNLAIGVQKQWNQLALQITPYLSAQIKSVSYKRENLNYGLRLKLVYAF